MLMAAGYIGAVLSASRSASACRPCDPRMDARAVQYCTVTVTTRHRRALQALASRDFLTRLHSRGFAGATLRHSDACSSFTLSQRPATTMALKIKYQKYSTSTFRARTVVAAAATSSQLVTS